MTIAILLFCSLFATGASVATEPPAAMEPVPSQQQMAWQREELLMFCHFGIKTFYPSDNHMGSGKEDPAKFNPTKLDARQWIRAAKAGGFKGIILTAKHHDGFCLWPTETTDFSVKSSAWKNGAGDVIRELADACHEADMWLGLYLSAYDVNYQKSGKDKAAYSKHYETQLTELCTNYGDIDELWFDGFGSEQMQVNWRNVAPIIKEHQPNAIIFNDFVKEMPQSSVRWPGNEKGDAGEPNWSVFPKPDDELTVKQDARWFPAEADTIAQGNWFWNERPICSLARLQKIYATSVGRGGVALINVPPNQAGLIDESSIARLAEFKAWVDGIYARDIARDAKASASAVRGSDPRFAADKAVDKDYDTYWTIDDGATSGNLEVDLGKSEDIVGVIIQEYIPLGQRIAAHRVEYWDGTSWKAAANGTTVGYKRIHWAEFKAQRVRLVITQARDCPLVNSFQVIRAAKSS